MRQPVISVCALLASFALGVGAALQVQNFTRLGPLEAGHIDVAYDPHLLDAYCRAIHVRVDRAHDIWLNGMHVGGLGDVELLENYLRHIEERRRGGGMYEPGVSICRQLPAYAPARRGVEVKVPQTLAHDELARVLRAAEASGAGPVSLTFDDDSKRF